MLSEINSFHGIPLTGEVYALLTALTWAIATILFKICGNTVAPAALNLFKNVIGFALLLITLFLSGDLLWPDPSVKDVLMLVLSGAIAIGLADTVFFASLNLLGASRSAIVDCLYSPFVIFFAWILLGEKLTFYSALGAGLIVLAVLLLFRKEQGNEITRAQFLRGVLLGAISMALMAIGIVIIKPQLNQYPVLWAANVRMFGGILCVLLIGELSPARAVLWKAFRPGADWVFLLPASVIGAYICFICWIAGMKYTQTNTASILNQTSSVLIVILAAIFLREPLNLRKGVAILLAFSGSILVLGMS